MTCVKKISILCLIIPIVGCAFQKEHNYKIKQGVFGRITWLEGNFMPSPDVRNGAEGKPVVRQLNIYEAIGFDKVQGQAPLFTSVKGKLVKILKSKRNGFYEANLPVGTYSIFTVEDDDKLFANSFDVNNYINLVKVLKDSVTKLDIQINYKAAY